MFCKLGFCPYLEEDFDCDFCPYYVEERRYDKSYPQKPLNLIERRDISDRNEE